MLKTASNNGYFLGVDLLKINQAAKALRVSRGTIYKYVALKILDAELEITGNERIGELRDLKFDPGEIERFRKKFNKRWSQGKRLV
jgi:predicted DNA-binding transcriptional regulator AlpA